MRLRNVKDKGELNNSNLVIKEPFNNKGKYKTIFNNNNSIHIEIGMGKGKFIIDMALTNPNINFIGIEKYSSVLIRAIQKVGEQNIPNLRFILMDAIKIDEIFEKEIEKIYLNFSDPWPKSKHEKRRLTSDMFLTKYEKIFIESKNVIMKTDNMQLFEYSLSSLSKFGYILEDVSLDLHNINDKENITTEYENKFSALGKPIYRVKAIKCK